MAQFTDAHQLQDVQPTDWAYTALNDLITRYDCLKGYPDGSFRGDRALSRYEFAAGLNACLQTMERLLAETTADRVTRTDLDTVQRLMQDFETELAQLENQVEGVESRLQFLEDNQFSTTTKLFGQVVVGLQGRASGNADFIDASQNFLGRDGIQESSDPNNEISLGYNAQLSLLTQFSPRSFLLTSFQAGNLNTNVTTNFFGLNNNFTRLGYESDTGNALSLSDLSYRHLVANNLAVIVGTNGVNPVNVFRGPSRIESAGFGPLSRFAQRNPIIQIGSTSAGLGFDWQATPRVSIQGVYSAAFANTATAGLFRDSYTLGLQAFITPTRDIDVSLYYLNSYSGSSGGLLQTGVGDEQMSLTSGARLNTDAFGATANWAIADEITLGTWVGFTDSAQVNFQGSAQTTNWMFSLQFPDLFAEGNYGAIFFGQPPRIVGSNLKVNGSLSGNIPSLLRGTLGTEAGGRRDRTLHLEGFYRWRLTDNITLTPGVIVLFNPGHNANNDTITIGAVRTTFSF
ncbi:MAG: iron uptake porin [Spirulina sp. SIO3F2]|nr:iron uptake porin [Spirulina sp. SIO3F2]